MGNSPKTNKTAKANNAQTGEVLSAEARKQKKNGKEVDGLFVAILFSSTRGEVDRMMDDVFTSEAKAKAAGMDYWPEAMIDVDAECELYRLHLQSKIPDQVANKRRELELKVKARKMVADGLADDVDSAKKAIAEAAKAQKTGDDDNVLADVAK